MGARYRRRPLSAALTIVLLVVLIAARQWREQDATRTTSQPPAASQTAEPVQLFHVKRVVDGDTLLLQSGERVRLIGIDTPESVKPDTPPQPYGQEASDFTKGLVEGRDVRLEFDRHREDQYGRTLAYVYIDDLFLNEEIVRQGFSRAETRFPFRSDFQKRFLAAEEEARAAQRGIWADASK
ncbi:MAG: thermonuclease family protein [Planctomycetaceae bacterium]|nr:thermonuclease family protein [Planctomycetaceae bacterium]